MTIAAPSNVPIAAASDVTQDMIEIPNKSDKYHKIKINKFDNYFIKYTESVSVKLRILEQLREAATEGPQKTRNTCLINYEYEQFDK